MVNFNVFSSFAEIDKMIRWKLAIYTAVKFDIEYNGKQYVSYFVKTMKRYEKLTELLSDVEKLELDAMECLLDCDFFIRYTFRDPYDILVHYQNLASEIIHHLQQIVASNFEDLTDDDLYDVLVKKNTQLEYKQYRKRIL
jgi:hypothetical protein